MLSAMVETLCEVPLTVKGVRQLMAVVDNLEKEIQELKKYLKGRQ